MFCSMRILTSTGAQLFLNVLVTDTLQGNTSMPKAHHANAFAISFKDKPWNTTFCLDQRHENQHSLSSNNQKG